MEGGKFGPIIRWEQSENTHILFSSGSLSHETRCQLEMTEEVEKRLIPRVITAIIESHSEKFPETDFCYSELTFRHIAFWWAGRRNFSLFDQNWNTLTKTGVVQMAAFCAGSRLFLTQCNVFGQQQSPNWLESDFR